MVTITVAVSALLLGVGYALGRQAARPPVQLVARVDSLDVPPPVVAEPRPTADLLDDFPDDTPPPPRGGSGQACACWHCCHPPTTGQWVRPAWLKTVDIMSRKGEQ